MSLCVSGRPRKYYTSTRRPHHHNTKATEKPDYFGRDFITVIAHEPRHTTRRPPPKDPRGPGGSSYEHYDPKYNLYDEPHNVETEDQTEAPTRKVNTASSGSSVLLVVGIIVVVIIAIVLIILIVIKIRSKGDVRSKMAGAKERIETEAERPSGPSHGLPGIVPTKPLVTAPGNNNNNGGSSKPVKEWYV